MANDHQHSLEATLPHQNTDNVKNSCSLCSVTLPFPRKIASKDNQHKKEPLRFDRLNFSSPGPEFADQLEDVALPLLTEMLGANVSKLVLCLHIFDGGSALLD